MLQLSGIKSTIFSQTLIHTHHCMFQFDCILVYSRVGHEANFTRKSDWNTGKTSLFSFDFVWHQIITRTLQKPPQRREPKEEISKNGGGNGGDFSSIEKRRVFFGADLLPTSKKSQQGEDDGTWKLAHIMRYNTLKLKIPRFSSVGMTHFLGRLLGLQGAIWDDEDINCKDLVIVFCLLWHLQCSPLTNPS